MAQKQREWIDEKTAAALVGTKPYTFRRNVKSGRLEITFTTINKRKYHYDKLEIEKLFENQSQKRSA